jgi:ComF family protein
MCGKELSLAGELEEPEVLEEQNQNIYELPQGSSGRIRQRHSRAAASAADFALSAICVEAVRPALLKTCGCRTYFPRFSECLCHECWQVLKIDLPLIAFYPLDGDKQSTLPIASGSAYEGKLKDLISEFKYEGERLLAQDLACVMVNAWSSLCEYLPPGKLLIVPVPLHWQRKHTRGFNQSELLAKELATTVGAPVASRAITRVKSTKPQQKLGRTERLDNIRGAFAGNPNMLKGRTIVLVDDVCTSGATLVACAEEALRCGARSVAALTIARAVLFASAAANR